VNAQLKPVVDFDIAQHRFHMRLNAFNARRMKPALPNAAWREQMTHDLQLQIEEGIYLEVERESIQMYLTDMPGDADSFMSWFESLREKGPGQNDALFPWIANEASLADVRWFITQEVAGEAGFDDLVALTQLQFPPIPKMEMARNYWDEMGRGHPQGMHGAMLANTAREFGIEASPETTVWESLALANVMAGLAVNRRYAFHSVGALGVIEMTAPGRVSLVNEGLKRLGVSASGRQYFQLHAGLDIRHSEAWNREVIYPLVKNDMVCAVAIAEGALMRLQCGQRCFARYRAAFDVEFPIN
jgi:hypothetical protein